MLQIFHTFECIFFPGLSYRPMYRKFKEVVLGLLAHVTPSIGHFQNEARCTTFLVKMSSICMKMKNDFHIKG